LDILNITTTDEVQGVASPAECAKCTAQVNAAKLLVESAPFQAKFTDFFFSACENPNFGVLNPESVCPGIYHTYSGTLLNLIPNYLLTRDRVCDMFLGYCTSPAYETLTISSY
jgi:hypothetical protein